MLLPNAGYRMRQVEESVLTHSRETVMVYDQNEGQSSYRKRNHGICVQQKNG